MNTCRTRRLVKGSFRALALALGDWRVRDARLREPDAGTAIPTIVSLLGDADPNVRIGACRLVEQNVGLLVQAAPRNTLTQLQDALEYASSDWAANEYAYGGFQCDEDDIQYVAKEAKMALASLTCLAGAANVDDSYQEPIHRPHQVALPPESTNAT